MPSLCLTIFFNISLWAVLDVPITFSSLKFNASRRPESPLKSLHWPRSWAAHGQESGKVVAGWCHQGGGKLVQPPTGAIDCRRLACSSSGVHALPSVPTSSTGPAGHVRPADSRWAAPTNPSLAFPPGFAPAPGAQPHSAPAHQVAFNHLPQSFSHPHTGGAAEEGLAATAVAEPPCRWHHPCHPPN